MLMGIILGASSIFAQVGEHEVPALKSRAMERFESGDYRLAESDFRTLMGQFSRDPMYRYYTAICLVRQNRELDEAIELLQFASTRGVPEDVWYYLAEAYRKNYNFEKAKQYYLDFDREAPRSMTRAKDSKFLISSVNTAMQITSTYNPFEVLNVTFLNLSDPEQYSQIRMKGGVLMKKPEVFFGDGEDQEDLNSLMFMPRNPERGQLVYFSGLERNGRNGLQIMQAKRGNTGKWIDIEPVDALNSDGDEIMPYYDPVGRDLYFASDGLEGLGGFDLFRSHYDEEHKEWSEPVNLGFPVNSTVDDYLLLPGTDLGMVIFFSGRQATDTAVAVYRVQLSEPKKSLADATPRELRKIADLDNVANEVLRDYEAYRVEVNPERELAETATVAKSVERHENITGVKAGEGAEQQDLISVALKRQTMADSLTELASEARIRVRESDDPNDRWLYQKQIMVWEKKAAEEQEAADQYFKMIASGKKEQVPEVLEKDTVINDMTVYRFAKPEQVSEKAKEAFTRPGKEPVEDVKKEEVKKERDKQPESQQVKASEVNVAPNRFEMMDRPAYSASNPIPLNTALPEGVFYRIQLGVFSNDIDPGTYGGIFPVTGESVPGRGLTRYYAGKFSNYGEARKALDTIRSAGYSDAFIVAWYNGKRMSVDKAKNLEK